MIKLATINDVLRRIGFLLVVGGIPSTPEDLTAEPRPWITFQIIRASKWRKREGE